MAGDAVLLQDCLLRIGRGLLAVRRDRQQRRGKETLHSCSPNFLSNATALGLASGGRIARKIPFAKIRGVRPPISFTSSFAPWSARIWIIDSQPRFAAPWMAVIPSELAALTSAPRSRQSFTASTYSASLWL